MGKPDAAHRWTDEQIEALEDRITAVFSAAAQDMQVTVQDYFSKFQKRDEEARALVEAGQMTAEEYQTWRLTQVARGERFEAMKEKLAERMTAANDVAIGYVNSDMAKVYAHNRTYTIETAADKVPGLDVDWTLWDENTVKRLLVEQPDVMPYYPKAKAVGRGIDLQYGKAKITQEVTSGIVRGDSINAIARNLMDRLPTMSKASAVRAARTAMTEAQNAGRQAAGEALAEMGVITRKFWIATEDDRTRTEHLVADGQSQDDDAPFIVGGEKLMYPGDQSSGASGWNLYNCRCCMAREVVGFKSTLSAEKQGAIKVTVE